MSNSWHLLQTHVLKEWQMIKVCRIKSSQVKKKNASSSRPLLSWTHETKHKPEFSRSYTQGYQTLMAATGGVLQQWLLYETVLRHGVAIHKSCHQSSGMPKIHLKNGCTVFSSLVERRRSTHLQNATTAGRHCLRWSCRPAGAYGGWSSPRQQAPDTHT